MFCAFDFKCCFPPQYEAPPSMGGAAIVTAQMNSSKQQKRKAAEADVAQEQPKNISAGSDGTGSKRQYREAISQPDSKTGDKRDPVAAGAPFLDQAELPSNEIGAGQALPPMDFEAWLQDLHGDCT